MSHVELEHGFARVRCAACRAEFLVAFRCKGQRVLVGTTASVICQLEDADYSGRSLTMLQRIAAALSTRIELRFVPIARTGSTRKSGKKRRIA